MPLRSEQAALHQGFAKHVGFLRHPYGRPPVPACCVQVYNITPYLRFHPGGSDMLMKAAGKAAPVATSALGAACMHTHAHAWVLHC